MKKATIAGLVLVFSFLFSMFPVSLAESTNDWPMFHHDPAHTGYLTSSISSASPSPTLSSFLWNYTAGSWVYSSPAVTNGVVYVTSGDQKVYALNASTGVLIWSFLTGYEIYSSPAVSNGVVYVSSGDGIVYALNSNTGDLIWNYNTESRVDSYSSPAVVNGIVYVGSLDDNVYALNASTGVLIWKYTTGDAVISSPAVVNGIVYVGSLDDNVYALNASTGVLIWKYTTGDAVISSPAVVNGVVYIASGDHNIYALNANTGALKWNYNTGSYVDSSPAVANGVVYVGSYGGKFYALNAESGSLEWSYTLAYGTNVASFNPAIANGVVYFGANDGSFYALNSNTGDLIWNYQIGVYVESSCPAVANDVVYVGSDNGTIYAINVSASVIFSSGFEDGFNSWTSIYGGVSIVSSSVYSGSYAMKCSDPWGSLAAKTIGQQIETYTSAEFLFDKNVAGDQTLIGYRNWAGNPTASMGISVQSGRVFIFVQTLLPGYSYSQYELTGFLTAGTWYKFGLDVSSTSATICVNDRQVESLTQANIPATDSVNVGMFWGNGAYVGNLYVDNVQISTS